jgi:hypothetical protein
MVAKSSDNTRQDVTKGRDFHPGTWESRPFGSGSSARPHFLPFLTVCL